jgi:hypothetical protein
MQQLKVLMFLTAMTTLTACGSDSVCVFDSDEATIDLANASAFSPGSCSSGGDFDAAEHAARGGRPLTDEEKAELEDFRGR